MLAPPIRLRAHHTPRTARGVRVTMRTPRCERSLTLRWLAVDYGTRRIGLASCEPDESIAGPVAVLDATGDAQADARRVSDFAQRHEIDALVVGLPLNMDGSVGPQARRTLAFVEALRTCADRPVETFDERLTSFQADQWLDELAASRSRRRKLRDALAALAILQSFLAARRRPPDPDGSASAL